MGCGNPWLSEARKLHNRKVVLDGRQRDRVAVAMDVGGVDFMGMKRDAAISTGRAAARRAIAIEKTSRVSARMIIGEEGPSRCGKVVRRDKAGTTLQRPKLQQLRHGLISQKKTGVMAASLAGSLIAARRVKDQTSTKSDICVINNLGDADTAKQVGTEMLISEGAINVKPDLFIAAMRSLSESLAFQDPISDAELTVLAEEADCGRTQDGRQDLLEDTPTIDPADTETDTTDEESPLWLLSSMGDLDDKFGAALTLGSAPKFRPDGTVEFVICGRDEVDATARQLLRQSFEQRLKKIVAAIAVSDERRARAESQPRSLDGLWWHFDEGQLDDCLLGLANDISYAAMGDFRCIHTIRMPHRRKRKSHDLVSSATESVPDKEGLRRSMRLQEQAEQAGESLSKRPKPDPTTQAASDSAHHTLSLDVDDAASSLGAEPALAAQVQNDDVSSSSSCTHDGSPFHDPGDAQSMPVHRGRGYGPVSLAFLAIVCYGDIDLMLDILHAENVVERQFDDPLDARNGWLRSLYRQVVSLGGVTSYSDALHERLDDSGMTNLTATVYRWPAPAAQKLRRAVLLATASDEVKNAILHLAPTERFQHPALVKLDTDEYCSKVFIDIGLITAAGHTPDATSNDRFILSNGLHGTSHSAPLDARLLSGDQLEAFGVSEQLLLEAEIELDLWSTDKDAETDDSADDDDLDEFEDALLDKTPLTDAEERLYQQRRSRPHMRQVWVDRHDEKECQWELDRARLIETTRELSAMLAVAFPSANRTVDFSLVEDRDATFFRFSDNSQTARSSAINRATEALTLVQRLLDLRLLSNCWIWCEETKHVSLDLMAIRNALSSSAFQTGTLTSKKHAIQAVQRLLQVVGVPLETHRGRYYRLLKQVGASTSPISKSAARISFRDTKTLHISTKTLLRLVYLTSSAISMQTWPSPTDGLIDAARLLDILSKAPQSIRYEFPVNNKQPYDTLTQLRRARKLLSLPIPPIGQLATASRRDGRIVKATAAAEHTLDDAVRILQPFREAPPLRKATYRVDDGLLSMLNELVPSISSKDVEQACTSTRREEQNSKIPVSQLRREFIFCCLQDAVKRKWGMSGLQRALGCVLDEASTDKDKSADRMLRFKSLI